MDRDNREPSLGQIPEAWILENFKPLEDRNRKNKK